MIPQVYVVHCKSLTERREYLEPKLKELGINNSQWITDYDAAELSPEIIDNFYIHDNVEALKKIKGLWPVNDHCSRRLTDKEISLTIKVYVAFKRIAESNEQFGIMLEDDCLFCEDFPNVFEKLLKETPDDWDIIHFGDGYGMKPVNVKKRTSQNIYLMNHPASRCAEGILVKKDAALKITSTYVPFNLMDDWELAYQYYKHNLNVYWWEPAPVTQGSHSGVFKSSLR
jgi:GR25 family glycosyltransferase involved in LPS biosynthesis